MEKRLQAMMGVVLGVTLFGFLGICTRYFHNDCGLTSMDTVAIRLTFASMFLLVILGIFARSKLKISKKDLPYLLVFGVFKIMSDVTFFYAQANIYLGLATLLQMTAPYYVMLISLILFRERLSRKKICAVALGSIGAIMVTGVLFGDFKAEIMGMLSALISGLFFGMFLVGSRVCYERGLHPAASLFYTMLIADLIAMPFIGHGDVIQAVSDPQGMIMALGLGVMMTLVPFFLYAWSTQFIEPSLASMISVLEVVTATTVGFFVFGEGITLINVFGMTLVILSVVVMNIKLRSDYVKKYGKYNYPKFGLLRPSSK